MFYVYDTTHHTPHTTHHAPHTTPQPQPYLVIAASTHWCSHPRLLLLEDTSASPGSWEVLTWSCARLDLGLRLGLRLRWRVMQAGRRGLTWDTFIRNIYKMKMNRNIYVIYDIRYNIYNIIIYNKYRVSQESGSTTLGFVAIETLKLSPEHLSHLFWDTLYIWYI